MSQRWRHEEAAAHGLNHRWRHEDAADHSALTLRKVRAVFELRHEEGAGRSTLTLRKVRAVIELRHVEVELSFEQRPRGCGPSSNYDTSRYTTGLAPR